MDDLAHQLHTLADRLRDLEPARVVGELEALRVVAFQRVIRAPEEPPAEDRLLSIEEAAARLCVTPDWLRRRGTLPFVLRLSDGVVRYSSTALAAFIRDHLPQK